MIKFNNNKLLLSDVAFHYFLLITNIAILEDILIILIFSFLSVISMDFY